MAKTDLKWFSMSERPDDCDIFSRDWNNDIKETANAVFFPTSSHQVEECFDVCRKNNWRVVPRGGNTGLSGGTLILSDDLAVIATNRLRDCLYFDEKNQLLTASAGFTLQEINEYLEPFGVTLPLHMGSYGSALIGGIVSTNAGGMHAWRYGMARNLISAVECVSPNLGIIASQTSNLKNNLGLLPVDCIVGSEGYYGIVTQVTLRVAQLSASDIGLLVVEEDFERCQIVFNRIKANLSDFIDIVEFVSGHSPGAVDIAPNLQGSKWGLIIKLSGGITQPELDTILERFIENNINFEFIGSMFLLSAQQTRAMLAAREALPAKIAELGSLLKFDLRLDLNQISAFHAFVINLLNHSPTAVFSFFGHYQDGNVHLNISLANDVDGEAVTASVLEKVSRLGGAIAAEHGLGRMKRIAVSSFLDPHSENLRESLKPFFDREGLLV